MKVIRRVCKQEGKEIGKGNHTCSLSFICWTQLSCSGISALFSEEKKQYDSLSWPPPFPMSQFLCNSNSRIINPNNQDYSSKHFPNPITFTVIPNLHLCKLEKDSFSSMKILIQCIIAYYERELSWVIALPAHTKAHTLTCSQYPLPPSMLRHTCHKCAQIH